MPDLGEDVQGIWVTDLRNGNGVVEPLSDRIRGRVSVRRDRAIPRRAK